MNIIAERIRRKLFEQEDDVDVKKIISDLANSFSGSNEEQMKAVQLLKGLAVSDSDIANEFMKKLDAATTEIANEMLGNNQE